MGASLLAMAADQSTLMLNDMASSRASSLPQRIVFPTRSFLAKQNDYFLRCKRQPTSINTIKPTPPTTNHINWS
ncbi:hypothetical protein C1X65_15635 [Pseudomonas sp. FW305-70]|nr:hypothetical protein C1X65_15635 [Pseudomonas sp. FW305-70]